VGPGGREADSARAYPGWDVFKLKVHPTLEVFPYLVMDERGKAILLSREPRYASYPGRRRFDVAPVPYREGEKGEEVPVCWGCFSKAGTHIHERWLDGGERVLMAFCEDCYPAWVTKCDGCGGEVLQEKAKFHLGSPYCPSCFNREFVSCSRCGGVTPRAKAEYVRGEVYCRGCAWRAV